MKFIGNFCFWLIVLMSLSAGAYSFASSANIYTWIVVILLAATTTFINDRNEGKHDE